MKTPTRTTNHVSTHNSNTAKGSSWNLNNPCKKQHKEATYKKKKTNKTKKKKTRYTIIWEQPNQQWVNNQQYTPHPPHTHQPLYHPMQPQPDTPQHNQQIQQHIVEQQQQQQQQQTQQHIPHIQTKQLSQHRQFYNQQQHHQQQQREQHEQQQTIEQKRRSRSSSRNRSRSRHKSITRLRNPMDFDSQQHTTHTRITRTEKRR